MKEKNSPRKCSGRSTCPSSHRQLWNQYITIYTTDC